MTDYSKLENRIGYHFTNPDLLEMSLTHSSFASEHSMSYVKNNERLEFIGDGFLDAIIGNKLYEILSDAHEGALSRKRADVVRESSLADVARRINLGEYIKLGRGEANCGGRDKDSILSDALEALLGAIILDGGYDSGREMVLKLFHDKIELAVEGKLSNDYKSRLQEKLQELYKNVTIKYVLTSESGPDHDKTFTVELTANDKVLGSGTGKSKAKAEQAAAHEVLLKGEYRFVF